MKNWRVKEIWRGAAVTGIGILCSCENKDSNRHINNSNSSSTDNSAIEDDLASSLFPSFENLTPQDRQLARLIIKARNEKLTMDEVLEMGVPASLLFDGRKWTEEGNYKFFRLHQLGGQRFPNLNRGGDYFLWKFPEFVEGADRDSALGIAWPPGGDAATLIYVEIENYNVER